MPINGWRGRPAWQTCVVVGAVATVGYVLLPAGGWQAAGYGLIGAACLVAVTWAVAHYRPQQPATWHTFIAGLTMWVLSTVVDRLTSGHAWSLTGDLLELAGYPLICWALFGLIRGRARAQDRTAWVDAGMIATSLWLLYWIFVLGATVSDPVLPWTQKLLAVLIAGGDIALFVLGSLLVTTPGARTVSYRLMLTALLLTAASDILLIAVPSQEFDLDGATDAISLLGNTLVAAAALHPSMRRLTVPLRRPPAFVRPRLILLTATILLAPAVGLYKGATGRAGQDWLPTGIGSIILFLLVAARMAGLVRRIENQADRLTLLARQDSLTGLANRRQWDERLTAAVAEHRFSGGALFVALIDLDHFKIYNDTYGHQAGDELLAGAAAAWGAHVRDGDLLARYGGEEFGLLFTGCTAAEATAVLERLLSATPSRQTFSAGLARWDGQESPGDLLHRADQLLYASKRAGRARVTAEPVAAAAAS
ncbi:GGDEF domain-containing protein [Actinoplanes sp. HUAS TT8]|uniref:GGDEF domain-containing protein n=1 Tax=Actinoplanes sp. HUAS TT8 TaxID=3447453 RepID=UPI003F52081B